MNILLLANSEEQVKIKSVIENESLFFEGEQIYWFSEFKNITNFDRIVVDENRLTQIAIKCNGKDILTRLFVWIDTVLISAEQPYMIESMQKKAIEKNDWDQVKRFNRIGIDLNVLARKEILNTYPSQLQMESTSYCNAQCIMCSHYYAGNRGAVDMDERMLERLREILPYLDVIILHGNGEPFISRRLKKSTDMYGKYHVGLTTNTNLSILGTEQIDLINRSFFEIRVSCDACTQEIYEGIRKGLSFEKFKKNAETLRDCCPGIVKTMASVVMRQNVEQIPNMVRFAAKYGFQEIIFSNLGTSLIVNNDMDKITHYPYYAAKQLRLALKAGQECQIKVTLPSAFDLTLDDENKEEEELEIIHSKPFFKNDAEIEEIRNFAEIVTGEEYRVIEDLKDCFWEENLYKGEGICEWCIEKPYMDLKGNVYVCCINATYRVGNIFDYDSFLDLWNNETYRKIRRIFYSGQLPGFCDNCQFICNHSLKRLEVKCPNENFYHRRHISRFYYDYVKEHGDGGQTNTR